MVGVVFEAKKKYIKTPLAQSAWFRVIYPNLSYYKRLSLKSIVPFLLDLR